MSVRHSPKETPEANRIVLSLWPGTSGLRDIIKPVYCQCGKWLVSTDNSPAENMRYWQYAPNDAPLIEVDWDTVPSTITAIALSASGEVMYKCRDCDSVARVGYLMLYPQHPFDMQSLWVRGPQTSFEVHVNYIVGTVGWKDSIIARPSNTKCDID